VQVLINLLQTKGLPLEEIAALFGDEVKSQLSDEDLLMKGVKPAHSDSKDESASEKASENV
jgi:hypothetical protein